MKLFEQLITWLYIKLQTRKHKKRLEENAKNDPFIYP